MRSLHRAFHFCLGIAVLSVAVPLSGPFVYVANGFSNNVSGFKIDAGTGALTTVPDSPFALAAPPPSPQQPGSQLAER